MDENGAARVPFGAGESQSLPLEWAAGVLTLWREEHPEAFGWYLSRVVAGAIPKAPGARR